MDRTDWRILVQTLVIGIAVVLFVACAPTQPAKSSGNETSAYRTSDTSPSGWYTVEVDGVPCIVKEWDDSYTGAHNYVMDCRDELMGKSR